MEHELFVEQPSIEFKEGIKVTEKTELAYKNEKVKQTLKNLVLETILEETGTDGIHAYRSRSFLTINLNDGDILLFNKDRGYYMPPYPVTTVEDAISDMESLKTVPKYKEE